MINKLKRLFTTGTTDLPPAPPVVVPKQKKPRKPKVPVVEVVPDYNAQAKEAATARGEPWVSVLSMDVDLGNLSDGNFNLDFNEVFVARLVKAGYRGKNDFDIVDQWFTEICKNVALETFAQDMADPDKRAEWNEKSTPTS
jgi:hypothetical protein